jgi:hypothetical protein
MLTLDAVPIELKAAEYRTRQEIAWDEVASHEQRGVRGGVANVRIVQ